MKKDIGENICKEDTFELIYNTYSKDVYNFIYYKYGEQSNPNDKTQEAFIKLWDNCKKVAFNKARSYLFTIANNMALNDIKHQKVVLKYQQAFKSGVDKVTPEFILEQEQFYDKYKNALAKLTQEQRVAFLLNKTEGKKHSEIAEQLGVTKKVVEYRIYSAFKIIKEELGNVKIK